MSGFNVDQHFIKRITAVFVKSPAQNICIVREEKYCYIKLNHQTNFDILV